jgi:tetratricopeptide (TPR) repeat protein
VISLNKKAFDVRLTNAQATINLADSALKIAKRINYIPGIGEAHRTAGIGYAYLDNIKLSVKNYLEALKYFKELNDNLNRAKVYNNIGNLYRNINRKKALEYFRKSLTISSKLNNEQLIGGLYLNIAMIYMKNGELKKSLSYYEMSNDIFKRRNDTLYMIIYLQNTGIVYTQLNNIEEAKARLIHAIKEARKHNLYQLIIGCYLTLSDIYIKEKDFRSAKQSINKGIKYSKILNNKKTEYDFIHTAYELENRKGDFKNALKYLKIVYKHDSLQLNNNQSDNIGITSQHYIQLQEIQEKELEITRQKFREVTFKWIITLGILIFVLTSVVVLVLYFMERKKWSRKELLIQNNITSLKQKALQAMMNPHFVFNVMTTIQHFINQADLKTANQILTGFANLARKHLEICMHSTISVQEELVYLQHYLYLEKIRCSDKMEYEIIIDEEMDTGEIFIPSMLIQPFIENAIWHGIMPKDEGGIIKLDFKLNESELFIRIVDNGIGIRSSEETKKSTHTSRGMSLIRERVGLLNKLNKRHIFIDQRQVGEEGTEVLIRIPA